MSGAGGDCFLRLPAGPVALLGFARPSSSGGFDGRPIVFAAYALPLKEVAEARGVKLLLERGSLLGPRRSLVA